MPWVAFYVGIAVVGLAVLGLLTFRLYRQVRQLARDVGAAGERISAASAAIEQVGAHSRPPAARRS